MSEALFVSKFGANSDQNNLSDYVEYFQNYFVSPEKVKDKMLFEEIHLDCSIDTTGKDFQSVLKKVIENSFLDAQAAMVFKTGKPTSEFSFICFQRWLRSICFDTLRAEIERIKNLNNSLVNRDSSFMHLTITLDRKLRAGNEKNKPIINYSIIYEFSVLAFPNSDIAVFETTPLISASFTLNEQVPFIVQEWQ